MPVFLKELLYLILIPLLIIIIAYFVWHHHNKQIATGLSTENRIKRVVRRPNPIQDWNHKEFGYSSLMKIDNSDSFMKCMDGFHSQSSSFLRKECGWNK